MKRSTILALSIVFLCNGNVAFSQNLLSSSKLDWELVPAGFLEPRLEGELGLEALSERFSDKELALATYDKDCYALAYVLLIKKKGLERSLPVRKELNEVEASFLDLLVRVRYEKNRNGFGKTVYYPGSEGQQQRIINASQRLIGVERKNYLKTLPKESWLDGDNELISAIGPLNPVVEFVSMSPRVVVAGKPSWKSIHGKEMLFRTIGNRNDWKGVHLLLSETFCPDTQQVESTTTGFNVNCNGLSVSICRNGEDWEVSFPREERERVSLAEFWSLRSQSDNKAW
ncbi:hypothetical protein SH501x_002209 [Pirellulaceae bacterium SH501]